MAPTVHKCAFCGYDIAPGTGSSYVRRDGRVFRFCSSKCRKSMILMRRDARKFKWTTSWGQQR